MITPFGKEIRKVRIDKNASLRDMAGDIGVSAAFLSAVETGKKTISDELFRKITKYIGVEEGTDEFKKLKQLKEQSQSKIEFPMTGTSEKARETVAAFARRFEDMEDDDFDELLRTIMKD